MSERSQRQKDCGKSKPVEAGLAWFERYFEKIYAHNSSIIDNNSAVLTGTGSKCIGATAAAAARHTTVTRGVYTTRINHHTTITSTRRRTTSSQREGCSASTAVY